MSRRRWVLAAAVTAVVAVIVAAVALYLFQPWRLLTRSTVDEALPMVTSSNATGADHWAEPVGGAISPSGKPSQSQAPELLAAGTFVDAEHATSGTVKVIQLADGSRFLRLEGLASSDGPDLHVWLTDQPSGGDWGSHDDGRHVALGPLKGTDGHQNYAIPPGADLSGLISVVIWCDRFNVAFGTAALRSP